MDKKILIAAVITVFGLGAAATSWGYGLGDATRAAKDTQKAVDDSVRAGSKEAGSFQVCRIDANEFRKGCVDATASEVRYMDCTERDSVIVDWSGAKLESNKIGAQCVNLSYQAYTKGTKSCPHDMVKSKANSRANRYSPPCSVQ